MSFSVYLNSANGTQVAGNNNQITYNFDFTNTATHTGGYKVYMSFAMEPQTYNPALAGPAVVRMADLGTMDSFSPTANFTGNRYNHVMGIIRPSPPFMNLTTSGTGTPLITTSTGNQTIDARFTDNPPVYMPHRPSNNQFTVRVTEMSGSLYTYLTKDYVMILYFEAIHAETV